MIDLEAEMAKALDGKFFWEPTASIDDSSTSKAVLDIRRAQKKFAVGAVNVTARNINGKKVEYVRPMKTVLKGEEKVLEPILKAISKVYGVSADDILSHSREYKFAPAKKHFCWAMFRYIPGMTTLQAGRLLKKCHSTVIHNRSHFDPDKNFEKVVEVDLLMGRV